MSQRSSSRNHGRLDKRVQGSGVNDNKIAGRTERGFASVDGAQNGRGPTAGRRTTRREHDDGRLGGKNWQRTDTRFTNKTTTGRKLFSDNSHLSTLVSKVLHADDNKERRISALKNLREYIFRYDHVKEIQRQADNLLIVLYEVISDRSSNSEICLETAFILAAVGNHMGHELRRFFQWVFGKVQASSSDNIKSLLLLVVVQTLQPKPEQHKSNISYIMTSIQTTLENADTPDLLISAVNAIHFICQHYPNAFNDHFKDTVDILVGWHIDTSQKPALIDYCADSLMSFHRYWLTDINFSFTLLGQFLEDMEAYAEDLGKCSSEASVSSEVAKADDDEQQTPDVCLKKILALTKVFTTVVKCLGDGLIPKPGSPITPVYLSEIFKGVVRCVETVQEETKCDGREEAIMYSANECLSVLCDTLQASLAQCQQDIISFTLKQLDAILEASFPRTVHILSPLGLLHKVLKYQSTNLPSDLVDLLYGPGSKFKKLRFHNNQEVLGLLLKVYQRLLCIKDVPMLETIYSFILADLQIAYDALLNHAGSDIRCQLVTGENPLADYCQPTIQQAEIMVIFNLSTLSEIGGTKSSIIVMWALSPSLFELLTRYMSASHWPLALYFPAAHFALLNVLSAHSKSNGHFISSSFGLASTNLGSGSSKTSGYFRTILNLLGTVLPHPSVSSDSRHLCLQWFHSILQHLQQGDYKILYVTAPFNLAIQALLPIAHSKEPTVCLGSCLCLQLVLECGDPCIDFLLGCLEICKMKVVCPTDDIKKAYISLMSMLPSDILLRSELSPLTQAKRLSNRKQATVSFSEADPQGLQAFRLARRSHIAKTPLGTFHSQDFRTIMGYILLGVAPSDSDWLEKLYHSCQRPDKAATVQGEMTLLNFIDGNVGLQWFWATWEAAQFCILAKLRTPLGKPQETFRAIEAALLEFGQDVKSQTEENEGIPSTEVLSPEYFQHQLRPFLLLQFLEHLEKLMYNAYEGCAMAMPSTPKAVRTFFRTNRATCKDWLRSIRHPAVTAATNCGQHAIALQHGLIMLRDLIDRNSTADCLFEDTALRVVTSLVKLHSPHAVTGLYHWILEKTGRVFGWMMACLPAAQARHKACINETITAVKKYLQLDEVSYQAALTKTALSADLNQGSPRLKASDVESGQPLRVLTKRSEGLPQASLPSPSVVEFLLNQVTQSYIATSDWAAAFKWQETLAELRSMVSNDLQKHVVMGCDINVIKALRYFDEREFTLVASCLDLIPGLSPDSDSVHMTAENIHCPDAVLLRGELELVRALTHYHKTGCSSSPVPTFNGGATDVHPELANVIKMLERASCISESCLALAWHDWPCNPPAQAAMQLQQTNALKNTVQGYMQACQVPMSKTVRLEPTQHDISIVGHVPKVMNYQHSLCQHNPSLADMTSNLTSDLCKIQLATIQLARRQGNYRYAQNQLCNHLEFVSTTSSQLDLTADREVYNSSVQKGPEPLLTTLSSVMTDSSSVEMHRAIRESAKLLQAIGHHQEAWEVLSRSCLRHTALINTGASTTCELVQVRDVNARSLLSLVKWFVADYRNAVPHLRAAAWTGSKLEATTLSKSVSGLLEAELAGASERLGLGVGENGDSSQQEVVGNSPAISDTDAVCGRLLHLATMQAPSLAKTWSSLASWCYRWGRKAVDVASSEGGVQLTSEEKAQVLSSLPVDITDSDTDAILSILSQAHCSATSIQEEDILEQLQSIYHDGTETTRHQLLNSCPSLQATDPQVVDSLLEVWSSVCCRIFSHYRLAARSYFTFLKLAGEPSKKLFVSHHISSDTLSSLRDFGETEADSAEAQAVHEDGNITTTLRLLRLLVKYAAELRDVLEDGLAHTPTGPWKSIIPQLFSRLSHPEAYVRQSISDLLCRVAHDSPHLIIYQAVVGCPSSSTEGHTSKGAAQQGVISKLLTSPTKDTTAASCTDEGAATPLDPTTQGVDDDDEEHTRFLSILEDCLTTIVGRLSKHSPTLVSQVEGLVQELRRITVLWEELWLGTLTQLHVDVTRRLHQLEDEVKRVQRNEGLSPDDKKIIIAEKHNAIMKLVVYSLEQVHSITSQSAETPNEKAFQDMYKETIEKALNSLKNPDTPHKPQSSWMLFKQLYATLQQRATRKATFMLQMKDISPKLASMEETSIPLPGLVCHHSQVVSIASFDNSVNILPTKTKPKKLVFHGADGKRYTYLFKGLEDLHLDERIMQFLSIVNTMFARNKRQEASLYHACHYSVTPLGPRSGLIQWVDGATALFGLYKRWQQRQAAAVAAAKGSTTSTGQSQVPRPSEVYYEKMKPALEEKGISEKTARKDWPVSVMRSVMQDLIKETPSDLLSRELWCSSGSYSEWWHMTQAYSRSTAVMSVIGYIIGLGDRHLDNVLVNFISGDVVHIDYNVCFEKGKNLRVPERVPFRMTQNIREALGVTGVEGTFRQSSEEVLKIMRRGRETLLTLLEAFVYDPLVDWTTANEGGFASAVYGGGQMNPVVADGGQNKREMEREITWSLFSSRVAEMKAPWFKNRDELVEALSKLEDQLAAYLEAVQRSKELESHNGSYSRHIRTLQAALNDKSHSLHTLHKRYAECHHVDSAKEASLQALQEKLSELSNFHIQHKLALETARGNHLAAISQQTSKDLELGLAPYTPCVDFLMTAGQTQVIGQCERLETELSGLLKQRRTFLRGCVEVLCTYCNMAGQFPVDFAKMNRAYEWQQWLRDLIYDMSSQKAKEIQTRFRAKYSSPTPAHIQRIVATEQALNGLMADANSQLVKAMEVVAQSDLPQMEGAVQATHEKIYSFVKENGEAGMMTLATVLMNALCSFSQRSLIMEGAVAGAGDLLVDFTSRNGNWFLEELCSMIANLDVIVNLVTDCQWPQEFDADTIIASLDCFHLIRLVYEGLQFMHSQFRKVILPRTIASFQSREPSIVQMLASLQRVCDDTLTLSNLILLIEQDLTSVTLGMKGERVSTNLVQELRSHFASLLRVPDTAAIDGFLSPSEGQKLLALLSSPFSLLDANIVEFVTKMEQLAVPPQWRKVDIIQEAKGMQSTVLNSNTVQLLRDWAFIKQLDAMLEFLILCQQFAQATNEDEENTSSKLSTSLLAEARFIKPIKKFMAGFIRKQTIGILSQTIGICTCTFAHQLGLDTLGEINAKDIGANSKASLEDMCKKTIELAVHNNLIQSHLYGIINNYTKSYDAGWRALTQARQQVNAVTASQETTQHAQLQIVRYQWLHEDILRQASSAQRKNVAFLPPTRTSVMSDLRKRTHILPSLEGAIKAVQERANTQQSVVSQRLKWAAGANPTLNNVAQEFEKAVRDRTAIYTMENKRSAEVSVLSNAILHFEALRTRTSEALNAEANFASLITRYIETCRKASQCTSSISELEQTFIELKAPSQETPINNKWIYSVLELIKQRTTEKEDRIAEQEALVHSGREALHALVDMVKNTLSTHHKLMSEVKVHLKTLARGEEEEAEDGFKEDGVVKMFMADYKTYSEEFTSTLKSLLIGSSEDDKENVLQLAKISPNMKNLADQTERLCDQLVGLAAPLVHRSQAPKITTEDTDEPKETVVAIGNKTDSPVRLLVTKGADGTPATPPTVTRLGTTVQQTRVSPSVMRDPRTGKIIQVRNAHAINVWRRVKGKLDGRDPDPSKRLSISEQVDFVIKEATSLENLATLYEGWTAWV